MSNALEVPATPEDAEKNRESLQTKSKTAWKAQAVHKGVVLPSGAVIAVKVPNLAALAQAGEIPNELVDIATTSANAGGDEIPADALEKLAKLQDYLVAVTVVEPKITQEDVKDLPTEDITFITEIAYRQRDIDAVGNSISGLDRVSKYATFRDNHDGDEALLDV
jgi:hypothetical protein